MRSFKISRHWSGVLLTSEDYAIVHVSADVQVALAYAVLDQPCSRGQAQLEVL